MPDATPNLPAQRARLARLFTAAVLGNWEVVREVRRAAPRGEPNREWREALLQVHVFAGFPRLVQAFGVLESEGGLGHPAAEELEQDAFDAQRGAALFDTIYAQDAAKVRGMLEGYHPDFATWIAHGAYARVLARPGLSAATREMLACCALAALDQERQLASHARGCVRCGGSFEELLEALESVRDLVGAERMERALRIVGRFRG